jgi:hypothetical protein
MAFDFRNTSVQYIGDMAFHGAPLYLALDIDALVDNESLNVNSIVIRGSATYRASYMVMASPFNHEYTDFNNFQSQVHFTSKEKTRQEILKKWLTLIRIDEANTEELKP